MDYCVVGISKREKKRKNDPAVRKEEYLNKSYPKPLGNRKGVWDRPQETNKKKKKKINQKTTNTKTKL